MKRGYDVFNVTNIRERLRAAGKAALAERCAETNATRVGV